MARNIGRDITEIRLGTEVVVIMVAALGVKPIGNTPVLSRE
jgi:hypothetical protein